MTDKELDILVNIIGGVESGGQVYGKRRYDAYAEPYKNSPTEHTVTLGWCQFYGNNARKLCQMIVTEIAAYLQKMIQQILKKDYLKIG